LLVRDEYIGRKLGFSVEAMVGYFRCITIGTESRMENYGCPTDILKRLTGNLIVSRIAVVYIER
jgi:hypothetical protein